MTRAAHLNTQKRAVTVLNISRINDNVQQEAGRQGRHLAHSVRSGRLTPADWQNGLARALGILLDGRAQPTGIWRRGTDITLFLALNAHHDVVRFTMPKVVGGTSWTCLIDTSQTLPPDGPDCACGAEFEAGGRTLLLFELKPDGRAHEQR
jgi:hypothetical protein